MQTQSTETSASSLTSHAAMAALVNRRFVTINECAEIRPFTAPALRDLKFKSADRKSSKGDTIRGNGTASYGVWLQIGAKVLIDLEALDRWIASHKT